MGDGLGRVPGLQFVQVCKPVISRARVLPTKLFSAVIYCNYGFSNRHQVPGHVPEGNPGDSTNTARYDTAVSLYSTLIVHSLAVVLLYFYRMSHSLYMNVSGCAGALWAGQGDTCLAAVLVPKAVMPPQPRERRWRKWFVYLCEVCDCSVFPSA